VQEIIFQSTQMKPLQLPSPCTGGSRVNSLSALNVVINDRLTAADHVRGCLHVKRTVRTVPTCKTKTRMPGKQGGATYSAAVNQLGQVESVYRT